MANHRYLVLLAVLCAVPCLAQSTLSEHMADHYARATQVQTAVINANLAAAKVAAAWLADHPVAANFPENALDEMRTAARVVVDAENIFDAARGTGRIGAACGHCHELMNIRTGLESNTAYSLGSSLPKRMSRHLWAADRMWEGLIGNSDEAWVAGAEMLLEAPLSGEDITGAEQPVIDYIGKQIHELASKARLADQREDRAELYGEFMARCASCHGGFRSDRRGPSGTYDRNEG